MLYTKK